MKQIAANVFTGFMDKDSDPALVAQGNYIDAQDIYNGYGGDIGTVIFAQGTSKLTLTLPAGTNTCIGAFEDKQTPSVLYFIHNSNNDHCIVRWFNVAAAGAPRIIARGAVLAFNTARRITHCFFVDGHLAYWTDAVYLNGAMSGEPQRMLDMTKADPLKDLEFEIYAGKPGEAQFAAGNEYHFAITDFDGTNATNAMVFTADGTQEDDPVAGLEWLANELAAYGSLITLTECDGCKIVVNMNTPGKRFRMTADEGDIIMVPVNVYPITLELQHIDYLKEPAHCAPSATFIADTTYQGNNVGRLCAQFIVRYIYYNGERSAWSPVSNIALNLGQDGEVIDSLNAIEIDFTDARLSDPDWLTMIRSVEVGFRDGNTNAFKLIDRYDVCEIGIERQYTTFYNDRAYAVIESDENSSSDTQALKPFDWLPIRSATMCASVDSEGATLAFLGDNEEGLPCPDCVTMDMEVSPIEDECLIDIEGRVLIENSSYYASADPDYDSYPMDGFIVYLAGTPYWAISNNPASGGGDGRFTIKQVPRGKYVVRVASFRCAPGGVAPRYDLNNGLEWQRTSSPVLATADSFIGPAGVEGGALDGITEFTIDTSDSGVVPGPVFDMTTLFSPGVITIYNQHHSTQGTPDGTRKIDLREVYVIDNNALDTDADVRIAALNVERQDAELTIDGVATVDKLTDHNGYFSHITDYLSDTFMSDIDYTVENSVSPAAALYKGDYAEMYDDTLVLMPTLQSDEPGVYFWVNKDEDFTARKRQIIVTVLDAAGAPLVGAVVVYQSTTRIAVIGLGGSNTITAYLPTDPTVPYGADTRTADNLLVLYANDICYEYYPATNPEPVLIVDEEPVEIEFEFTLTGGIPFPMRYLKGGGSYLHGIVYEDRGNRTCGVAKTGKVTIPWHPIPDGVVRRQVEWTISSQPPIWATHYRIVRTRNAVQSFYVQWAVKSVIYARIPSQIEAPIITTYEAGDYTHIFLELFVPPPPATSGANFFPFYQQDGQYSYEPADGDRVRFLLDAAGDILTTATVYYDAPISGKYVDGDGKVYAAIENRFGNLEIEANWLAEYYTPVNFEQEIYYEGGEDCYDILDAGLSTRNHAGPLQDQNYALGTPAKGLLNNGDTYWRRDTYTGTSSIATEHQSPLRSSFIACEDIGRAFTYDPDYDQILFYNRIRFSGRYVANSNINGLSSFRGLDYQDINRAFGSINWLGFSNNVLLAICQFKVQPVYINRQRLLQLDGDSSVGRSDRVLEIADESVTAYGTHNAESVVSEGSYVYFWDKYQGAVCRYAPNGVQPIVPGMSKYFLQRGRERMQIPGDQVIGGYDRRHAMYLLSFLGAGEIFTETVGYDEAAGGWKSRYRFVPEAFASVGQEFVSFKLGEIWRHFVNANYTIYYGTQFKPTIQFPANQDPAAVKRWLSLRLLANREWEATAITTPFNANYASGMSSRLKANRFNAYEGTWWADFLRDMNDTSAQFLALPAGPIRQSTALLNGRPLRSEVLIITLQAVDGSKSMIFKRADSYYFLSEVTNP